MGSPNASGEWLGISFAGRRKWLFAILFLAALAALSWQWWLPLPGEFLVQGDPPAKVDGIVVLAGDGSGYRIQAAAELAKQGYAPVVLVSGSRWFYDLWECDVAIDFAVRNGQPPGIFEPLRNEAQSTEAEMGAIFAEVRRRQWKSVLIVTSDYHTRRARTLANRVKPAGVRVMVFAAPDRNFRPDEWWWNRESRKIFVYEWLKTGAAAFGGL